MEKFKISGTGKSDHFLTGIRVPEDHHKIMKDLAKKNKISMQEVARQMIAFAIQNMGEK